MRASMLAPAARRRPGRGLPCLVMSGMLWGTGGLTGILLSRVTGLSALSVAAYRLTGGGVLIVAFLTLTGRRWPASRAAWARIAVIGALAALYQSCYFTAVALTSVAPTAVAYSLYFRGLRTAAASTGALLALLEPLTGTILAALVLGQHLSASGIVGAAVLALAVIITIFDADRGAGLIPVPG